MPFRRTVSHSHVHHILTNPVYAGRIRHKTRVFDGQQPAIFEPAIWDALQAQMQAGAARSRMVDGNGGSRTRVSRLTGKIFDETGDRLTPSHSKTTKGRRLRYYISHRLIRSAGQKDPAAWRLPAPELEALVVRLIRNHMFRPAVQANILVDALSEEIAAVAAWVSGWQARATRQTRAPGCFLGLQRV